jgi:sn1-specific diacylglycerol lipase
MTLNDLAADLTCDPVDFIPPDNICSPLQVNTSDTGPGLATVDKVFDEDEYAFINAEDIIGAVPGSYPGFIDADYTSDPPLNEHSSTPEFPSGERDGYQGNYQVHGGIYKMALAMGSVGRPVWMVVREALKKNNGYDLVLCGHSLGAGLSALLALVRFSLSITSVTT